MNLTFLKKRKRELFFILFFFVAFFLATKQMPIFSLRGTKSLGVTVKLDLLLCCTICLALLEGKRYAAPYALTAGFLFDVLVGNPYAFSPIVWFLCSYFAEKAAAPFSRKTPLSVLLVGAQVLAIKAVFSFLYLIAVSRDASVGQLFFLGVLPEYLVNTVGTALVFSIMRILAALFRVPLFDHGGE